ncbi:MAG TPA: hypothetical protein VN456_16205 [Desulfosporosinus sp.]|nr:hypothetical protein [Desulfosporosinus sp.]
MEDGEVVGFGTEERVFGAWTVEFKIEDEKPLEECFAASSEAFLIPIQKVISIG